jgi:Chaperone for flagella basal body P-ring formation
MRCVSSLIRIVVVGLFTAIPPNMLFAFGGEVRITLPQKIEVSSAQVFVHDVATVSSSDLGLLKRVLNLPLGKIPIGDESVSIQRTEMERWLRHAGGLRSNQIAWFGSAVVHIQRAENFGPSLKQSSENRASNFSKSEDQNAIVKVGDWVDARTKDGSVVLTSKAQVLTQGRVSDLIQIKLQHSSAVVTATIVDRGIVEIVQ